MGPEMGPDMGAEVGAVSTPVHAIAVLSLMPRCTQFRAQRAEKTDMNPFVHLLPSLAGQRTTARQVAVPSSLMSRIEVKPPQVWPSSLSWWGRVQRWLMQDNPWTAGSKRPVNRLALVKGEFRRHMDGLSGIGAARLADQLDRARSLRELWHLRSTLYGLLAVQFDQAEAERRMAQLNRHFPMRAPRAGHALHGA